VIDPFSDDCVVVTGSHNLGFRASHTNDENMVIIHGHRGLAEAYACNVLDVYDHYAWRFLLKEHPNQFGKPLQGDDKWQERYITGPAVKSAEMRFWLAAGGHAASSSPTRAAKQSVVSNSPPTAPESPIEQAPVIQQAAKKPRPSASRPIANAVAGKATKKAGKKTSKEAAETGNKATRKGRGKKAAKEAVKKAAKTKASRQARSRKAGKANAGNTPKKSKKR
jgi:hypothetical protein